MAPPSVTAQRPTGRRRGSAPGGGSEDAEAVAVPVTSDAVDDALGLSCTPGGAAESFPAPGRSSTNPATTSAARRRRATRPRTRRRRRDVEEEMGGPTRTPPGAPGRGVVDDDAIHGGRLHPGQQRRLRVRGQPVEPVGHLGHGGPGPDVGREHLPQQRRERTGVLRGLDVSLGDAVKQADLVRRLAERGPALERRIQRRAEGEDVGGIPGLRAPGHFRREVGRRAGQHAGGRHRAVPDGVGDAEVADPRGAVVGHEDVGRLDVAVDDAGRVGGGQRRGHLRAERGRLLLVQGGELAEDLRQGLRGDQLQDEARLTLVLDDVVDRHRVTVVQPSSEPRLPHGPSGHQLGRFGARTLRGVEDLQGDRPSEPLVPPLPHRAHAASSDESDEPVPARNEAVRRLHWAPLRVRRSPRLGDPCPSDAGPTLPATGS